MDDDLIDTDGRLTDEGMHRVYVELDLGLPVEASRLPDTALVRNFRTRAAVEVAAIKAKGHSVTFTAD